jgi:hypothetical protein
VSLPSRYTAYGTVTDCEKIAGIGAQVKVTGNQYFLLQIIVASDKEDKVAPIREAFQNVFGQATVVGLPAR